jgi:predicted molibdopterin-dependent oxidoreductase YjgC
LTPVEIETIKLIVDGQEIFARKGQSVLQAAKANGVYIPNLCYLEGLPPFAGCRMCQIEVYDKNRDSWAINTACTTPATDGLEVRQTVANVRDLQQSVLELIMAQHPDRCLTCFRKPHCPPFYPCLRDEHVTDRCVVCPINQRCELQWLTEYMDMSGHQTFYREERSYYGGAAMHFPYDTANPFIERDPNKCILCTRCTRACNEIRFNGALELGFRGEAAQIVTAYGEVMQDSPCEFCGACVDVCPVAAFQEVTAKFSGAVDRSISTTCEHCAVGCGLRVDVKRGKVVGVTPETGAIVNDTQLCVLGRFGTAGHVNSRDRVAAPQIRTGAGFRQATWEEALSAVAERLAQVAQIDPGAIGVFGSPKRTNEELYLLQKLARLTLGTNNVDMSAMAFHRPTVEFLRAGIGAAGSTTSFDRLGEAGSVLVFGNDTFSTHRVASLKLEHGCYRSNVQLVNAHPRVTDLDRFSAISLHYAPGSEAALLNGLLAAVLATRADRGDGLRAVPGFATLEAGLGDWTLEHTAQATGVAVADLKKAAEILTAGLGEDGVRTAPNTIVYGSGLSYQETSPEIARGIANLAIATDSLGAAGSGVLVLVSETNLQGGTDMGVLPDLLPGYQSLVSAEGRASFEQAWGGPLPAQPGLDVSGMLDAAAAGRLQALVLFGDDPLARLPDSAYVREALDKVPFVVAIGSHWSESARLARVVLPGTTTAEKEGSFTSAERRVQLVHPAIDPWKDARPDWWILSQIGWRVARALGKPDGPYAYAGPGAIMDEIRSLVPAYAGLSYERLEAQGLQWPCPDADHPGTDVVVHEPGGLRFQPVAAPSTDAEPVTGEYPLRLLVGQTLFGWLGDGFPQSEGNAKQFRGTHLEMHPKDAARLGVQEDDLVVVASRHGELTLPVLVRDNQPEGSVFAPLNHEAGAANQLLAHPNGTANRLFAVAVRPA